VKKYIVFKFNDMSYYNIRAVEFENDFTCTLEGVHHCFILNPGKMIFYSFTAVTVALAVIFKLQLFDIYLGYIKGKNKKTLQQCVRSTKHISHNENCKN